MSTVRRTGAVIRRRYLQRPGAYATLLLMACVSTSGFAAQSGTLYDQVTDPSKRISPSVTLAGKTSIQGTETLALTAYPTVCQDCKPFYYWQADGGTFSGGSDFSPTINWIPPQLNTARSYTIKLSVGDGKGEVASTTLAVQVSPTADSCSLRTDPPQLYNGGTYDTGNYTVTWSQVNNAIGYILQESTSDAFSAVTEFKLNGGDQRSYAFTQANGTYYYRVKSTNACGASDWSDASRRVVQANAAPTLPSGPTPSNGAVGVGLTPTLTWAGGDTDGVADYRVDLGTAPDALYPVQGYRSENAFNPSYKVMQTLSANTEYYWRISSRDDHGVETVGETWKFVTGNYAADLTPSAVRLSGKIANGSTVAVSTVVTNIGNTPSSGGRLRYYYSHQENARELEFIGAFSAIPNLQPGESTTITSNLTLSGLSSGDSYVVAYIDSVDLGVETDISNNAASAMLVYKDTLAPTINFLEARGDTGTFKTGASASVNFSVLDDIGATTVSLAYSLDGGLNWSAIVDGVAVTNNGYGNTYSWSIPATISPSGKLMLRLTAADAAGNKGQKQIGPYTLLDGTAPTVGLNSPAAGDSWPLGTSHVVTWSASSASGIKSSSVWFYSHGGTQVQKLGDVVGSGNSYSWAIPLNSFFVAQDAQIVIRVLDNNYNETRITSPSFSIVDPSLPPEKPWGIPSMPFALAGSKPLLAYDAAGTLHLSFTGNDGLVYARRVGDTWQGPWRLGADYGADSMAVDSRGRAHIVWSGGAKNQIFYARIDGASAWSTPLLLSDAVGGQTQPKVVVDSGDNVHAFWYGSCPTWTNSCTVNYRQLKSGLTDWSATSQPTGEATGFNYDVGVDPLLGVHLAYVGADSANNYVLRYVHGVTGVWAAPVTLLTQASSSGSLDQIRLRLDPVGAPWVAVRMRDALAKRYQMRVAHQEQGNWSRIEAVDIPNLNLLYDIAIGAQHLPYLFYESYDPSQSRSALGMAARQTNGDWSIGAPGSLATQDVGSGSSCSQGKFCTASSTPNADKISVAYLDTVTGNPVVFVNSIDTTADMIAPALKLSGIASGQVLAGGQSIWLTYAATDATQVNLNYSSDGGKSSVVIAKALPASGSLLWTVPNTASTQSQITINASDSAGNRGTFTIGPFSIAPKVLVNVVIDGPTRIGAATSTRYSAVAHYDDGSVADVSSHLALATSQWASLNGSTLSSIGVLSDQTVTLNVSITELGVTKAATLNVVISPATATNSEAFSRKSVALTGPRSNYTVIKAGNSLIVTDNVGDQGTSSLGAAQRIVFADTAVAFDTDGDGVAGQAYRLYRAAFNRDPDAAGLGYWVAQLDRGATLEQVSAGFISSAEFTTLYGSAPSNDAFVKSLYNNVLHRQPDQAGVDYWVKVLSSGVSRASVLASFSDGNENRLQVSSIVQSGVTYLPYAQQQSVANNAQRISEAGPVPSGGQLSIATKEATDSQRGREHQFDVASSVLPPAARLADYRGRWTNAESPGHGLDIVADDGEMLIRLFTLDVTGKPIWYQVGHCQFGANRCEANLLRPNVDREHPSQDVGRILLEFTASDNATVTYSTDSQTTELELTREVFGSGRYAPDIDYSGWWLASAEGAQSMILTQQYDVLATTLYDFDISGVPVWFAIGPCTMDQVECKGQLRYFGRSSVAENSQGNACIVTKGIQLHFESHDRAKVSYPGCDYPSLLITKRKPGGDLAPK